ncbi:MAG: adenine nucleotide alpha hydrolase [Actinobacteria bacterium]|nr:adenine nucleotide alpha hydrolase [Actinomycetota bacterium]
MCWSSGKDSAMALHAARSQGIEIVALLTTVNADADRVAMHAVRRSLLEAQAERLGLPLYTVDIPSPSPNDVYEAAMRDAIVLAGSQGVDTMVFGDLFLADIRAYREAMLEGTGIHPSFPLWQRPTAQLARQMLGAGVRAVLTCVDPRVIPPDLVGRAFDEALLDELPASVDPCGERGEFHTFCWDGPGFSSPIDVAAGAVVERDGFVFADFEPAIPGAGRATPVPARGAGFGDDA